MPLDEWSNFELCKAASRTKCTLARGESRWQREPGFDSRVDRSLLSDQAVQRWFTVFTQNLQKMYGMFTKVLKGTTCTQMCKMYEKCTFEVINCFLEKENQIEAIALSFTLFGTGRRVSLMCEIAVTQSRLKRTENTDRKILTHSDRESGHFWDYFHDSTFFDSKFLFF